MTRGAKTCAVLILAGITCVSAYMKVRSRPAYWQRPDQVVVRDTGKRYFGDPRPAKDEAAEHLPFALMSQAAYQRRSDAGGSCGIECLDPDAELNKSGWRLWQDFPSGELNDRIARHHLRVEVWSNASVKEVVVAFGGTEFSNLRDWYANLRWFIPKHNDEYTALINDFGPAFVIEFIDKRSRDPSYKFLADPETTLLSTGHSLGGGLAQEFAYSLNIKGSVPHVTRVYAFDPSPVTGYYSVNAGLRTENCERLRIDRIYERGEILAIVRSAERFVYPDSKSKPAIRQVRYSLFSRKPLTGHSISSLAYKLQQVSGGQWR